MIGGCEKIFSHDSTILFRSVATMSAISTTILVLIVLVMKMTLAQVVYQAEYEDETCSVSPYRYSTYTATCLNGRNATKCDTRAYVRVCNDCSSTAICSTN